MEAKPATNARCAAAASPGLQASLQRLDAGRKVCNHTTKIFVNVRLATSYPVWQLRSNEGALPLTGEDESGALEIAKRPLDRAHRHAEVRHEFLVTRELTARKQLPLIDRCTDGVRDLGIGRPSVVGIETSHSKHDNPRVARQLIRYVVYAVYVCAYKSAPTGAATPAGAHIETFGSNDAV